LTGRRGVAVTQIIVVHFGETAGRGMVAVVVSLLSILVIYSLDFVILTLETPPPGSKLISSCQAKGLDPSFDSFNKKT
jgi:hypothetical protein